MEKRIIELYRRKFDDIRYEADGIAYWYARELMKLLDYVQWRNFDNAINKATAADGKSYSINHYSLEMIIAVGFKVNSERAVQFREWVNQIAKDYTIKGWAMDDERLKNGGSVLTTEYFDRLLEQIREIRLSERRFYQKILCLI